MADPKDGESFFRKVVRFVANPATEWSDINASRQDDGLDLERSELKAMIERKRRNDFVRKREFDTLRRLRREGLSPEQLAALGGSSKVDDSEVRMPESAAARAEMGVKAKIDAIEQQMVGNGASGAPASTPRRANADPRGPRTTPSSRPADFYNAATEPSALQINGLRTDVPSNLPSSLFGDAPNTELLPALPPLQASEPMPLAPAPAGGLIRGTVDARLNQPPAPAPASSPWSTPSRVAGLAGSPPAKGYDTTQGSGSSAGPGRFAVEVSEVVHDPELDEAVIAFANAEFEHCEQTLDLLRRAGGARHEHGETWLVLFDLYRATGQQPKFEVLAMDYANKFGRSAPQWFSLPKLVADAAADERPDTRAVKGDVGWVSPAVLDTDAVARLRSTTLQLPLPWVLDWTALQQVEPEAASQLTALLRQWAPQRLDMRWMAADQLLLTLQEAAPTGVRDADPAFWMARLEALRLANRPDQFDETAIDYCVTYEVSPPSWEPAVCQVRPSTGGLTTTTPPMSIITEATSAFPESVLSDVVHAGPRITGVELSGQLAGDIGPVLAKLDGKLGNATVVQVSCARLIRVDFIAAGDLLNWVLAKQGEQRTVVFADAHRLVALFFGAMGINEHARVQVPRL